MRREMKVRPFPGKPALVGLIICLSILAALSYWFFLIPPSKDSAAKIILIKKGTPLRKVSEMLRQDGVIKEPHLFALVARILGKRGEIKAGEYEFHTRMLPLEVLDMLVSGQVKTHLVTIPEGFTLHQIADLLHGLEIVDGQAFVQKASSPVFIASLNIPQFEGPHLEGYLFPNTYHLVREMDPEEVIRTMVHQFKKMFTPELAERASRLGMSERDAVIVASIIEKETAIPGEKVLVSAVFHNRLMKKYPLQSDPTVIYGIPHFDGNLTRQHLLTPGPYNTYLVHGLPATPICNPGKESLWAAVNPAQVPYMYFVSRNDGSHYFSASIEDHNRAVSMYQRKK
jgi:UPF0755 protein